MNHWLAGLLEGEACFTWSRTPKVQLEMTDRDVVERAAREMKGRIAVRERQGRKMTYVTAAYGPSAVQVMAQVYPMMGKRRQERIEGLVTRYFGVPQRPVQLRLWDDA